MNSSSSNDELLAISLAMHNKAMEWVVEGRQAGKACMMMFHSHRFRIRAEAEAEVEQAGVVVGEATFKDADRSRLVDLLRRRLLEHRLGRRTRVSPERTIVVVAEAVREAIIRMLGATEPN
jgi:hypothetical protein